MYIHESIEKEIPVALRAKDEVRLRTLRALFADMTNEAIARHAKKTSDSITLTEMIEIKNHRFLNDTEAITVIKRAANQHKDSIEQYAKASRDDLVEPEKAELAILEEYLPTMMSREEIEVFAKAKQLERGYSVKADTGVFIGALMQDLAGQAEGADVKAVVEMLLA